MVSRALLWLGAAVLLAYGCGSDSPDRGDGTATGTTPTGTTPTGTTPTGTTPTGLPPAGECRSVRMTNYEDSGDRTACGYSKSLPFVAQFVKDGMTTAIAEPWYGSSYGGLPGEACGECWLITTPTASAVLMVTDLCPIEGNEEWCGGDEFHFDVATTAIPTIGEGWGNPAMTRPIACPLTGNIYVEVTDRSWGYFQVAFVNYIIPLRSAEVQAVGSSTWVPMERVWGEVFAADDSMFADGGSGGVIRITSAQGEVLTSSVVFTPSTAIGDTADLGVQFTDQLGLSDEACTL